MCKPDMPPGEACFYFKYAAKYYPITPQFQGKLKLVLDAQDEAPEETLAQQYQWRIGDHV